MSSTPILIAVTRTVRPGKEKDFEQALHEFIQKSSAMPGQMGVQIIRPAPGSNAREYGILRRFATHRYKDEFYRSDAFRQWEQRTLDLCEGPVHRESVTGLEAWFTLPGVKAVLPPPHWKMALTVLLAVFPATLVLPWMLQPVTDRVPGLLGHLIVTVCIVTTLTWIAMPLLNRLLQPWLHPESKRVPKSASHTAKPM